MSGVWAGVPWRCECECGGFVKRTSPWRASKFASWVSARLLCVRHAACDPDTSRPKPRTLPRGGLSPKLPRLSKLPLSKFPVRGPGSDKS